MENNRIKTMQTIIKLRIDLGMTQVEFAKFIGVEQSTVSCWETGRKEIFLESIRKIKKACDRKKIKINIGEFM